MSLKREISQYGKTIKIYYSPEIREYCVKFYKDDEYFKDADYFTDDYADAIGTANHFLHN